MGEGLTLTEGTKLVQMARKAASGYLQGKALPKLFGGVFDEPRSVFVTLSTYPKHELRGCIGFVQSGKKLGEAAMQAAVHAASNDTRFPPVQIEEIEKIVFEASVLTIPKILGCPASQRDKNIKIGKDGLILEYGGTSGLLLPQVATEWNFSPKDFLEALCQKAGLPKDMHNSESVQISTFGAQIFCEESPGGKILEKKLFV